MYTIVFSVDEFSEVSGVGKGVVEDRKIPLVN